ncbi:MAG TPA: hypothetical protein DCZ73_08475 [Bacteroides sp.]|nr:hypothetical protein [Bacteroides sp.]
MVMKKLYKSLFVLCMAFPFVSCEKDLPVYDYEECGLMFEYQYARDSTYSYSFAFGPSDVTVDTVELDVALLGNVVDYDRVISLRQIPTGNNDAQAGVHYVPFDDPSLVSKYVLPANATSAVIPVVLLRDASLQEADHMLKVTFQSNDDFSFVSKEQSYRNIVIADQLIKPNNWDSYCRHFFGTYGKVKHQFMIDETGFRWDNEYVDTDILGYLSNDQNVLFGLQAQLQNALEEYNATHEEPLREGEEYDYVLVDFNR